MKTAVQVYWLKRDVRWEDNPALVEVCSRGMPVVMLYIFDREQRERAGDWEARHWRFVYQSLQEMQQPLLGSNTGISIFYGYCEEVFAYLLNLYDIKGVVSHEEVGNGLSFARDLRMKVFFKQRAIPWLEIPQNGILRGLSQRRDWAIHWQKTVSQKPLPFPEGKKVFLKAPLGEGQLPSFLLKDLEREDSNFQKGGELKGQATLQLFLENKANNYMRNISKPSLSRESCSRISPYLAYGNLSVRQVYNRVMYLYYDQSSNRRDLSAFLSRLQWQGHFIQKFETRCSIETDNMNPAYDALQKPLREDWVEKWKRGLTGFPLVDACMRCVEQTGYLNFRMRAMVVSFLTHHLWQDWRSGAHHLAKQFLDYDPGIHYSQFQMQASTTGINMPRVYNPVKQSLDQDAEGLFIKEWVPELRKIPTPLLHQPWRLSAMEQILYNCRLGEDYPYPLVDYQQSGKYAVEKLWSFRQSQAVKRENRKILGVLTQRRKADQ